MNFKRIGFFATLMCALAGALIGCTEERAFDDIYKGDMVLKKASAVCNPNEKYLYVPSTVEASRTTTASRPYWMGEAKIVNLICDENQIRVVEADPEDRFKDNPTNNLPVLTIPIEHVDYKCDEDQDGKCTNKEVENDDISWKEKTFVRFLPEQMSVQEVNWFPEQIKNLFYPCFTPTGESLVAAHFEDDAINIKLQRSYKTSVICAQDVSGLNTLGFSVNYHYSIVKLSSIANPNYQKVEYTDKDETTFGFFNTKTLKLDVDNNDVVDSEKTYINRWMPGKDIVYYLSAGFQKPENKSLMDATKAAVETINNSLKEAGANLHITLKEADASLMSGDLRVSSIVLEDDPLATGVIGYGPTAANPETGEILQGRLVMYLGTLRKYIKYTYDEIVLKKLADQASRKAGSELKGKPVAPTMAQTSAAAAAPQTERAFATGPARRVSKLPTNLERLRDQVLNPLNHKISQADFRESPEALLLMKNCFFTADMVDFDSSLGSEIDKMIDELGLRTWQDLSEGERSHVLAILTPFVWTPVLVHEMGHNLGLRHNFAGSEDKDNFYSKEELEHFHVHRPITYSSVMDYSYSQLNELPVMGKYDVAALRFGYAGKIALQDGSEISVDEFHAHPDVEVKAYKYCTDEHTSVNPNCNVFDEGTNFTEMARHHIRAYEESYLKNNFRNQRRSFSLMSDSGQVGRLERTLGSLRRIFERYESIKHTFGIADNDPAWESVDFLKDLKNATKITAQFLIRILQTPDTMCAISKVDAPNQIVALAPIQQISTSAIDCFDKDNVQLNAQYMVVGQAGKSFQSKKDPHSTNHFVDQIDVRGIWIDKLVALDTLLGRKTGISTFDQYTDNFLDVADVADQVDAALRDLVMNQVVAPVDIHVVGGQVLTVNFPVSMFNDDDRLNGHRVIQPLDGAAARALGLSSGHHPFQTILVQKLKQDLPSPAQVNDPDSLLNALQVVRLAPSDATPTGDYVTSRIGVTRYAAHKQSAVAAVALASHASVGVLTQLPREQVQKIADDLDKGVAEPADATALQKAARALGKDILHAYLDDEFQSQNFYAQIIQAME